MRSPHYLIRPGTVLAAATTAAVGLLLAGHGTSVPAHATGDVPGRSHDRRGALNAPRLPFVSPGQAPWPSSPPGSACRRAGGDLVWALFSLHPAMSFCGDFAVPPNLPLCTTMEWIADGDVRVLRHAGTAGRGAGAATASDRWGTAS